MERGAILQCVANPIRMMNSTRFRFNTGKTPGIPRHTGQTFEFGSCPNFVEQLQKALDSVSS
jgi:hypothetical protein